MKSVEKILSERTTCRRYERIALTDQQRDAVFAAIRNTPTSFNAQNFTVIYIDDPDEKETLYQITGQKQIKTSAAFLVFCADFNKLKIAGEVKGMEMSPVYNCLDGLVDGTINASLALMSALVTAESLGLGTCPIGYMRTADPQAIAKVLGLPQHVAVICGLAIGVPREHNDLKPKLPTPLAIMHNTYTDSESMIPGLLDYDAEIKRYNAARAGGTTDNDWVGHMLDYYKEMYSLKMLDAMRARGFDINH